VHAAETAVDRVYTAHNLKPLLLFPLVCTFDRAMDIKLAATNHKVGRVHASPALVAMACMWHVLWRLVELHTLAYCMQSWLCCLHRGIVHSTCSISHHTCCLYVQHWIIRGIPRQTSAAVTSAYEHYLSSRMAATRCYRRKILNHCKTICSLTVPYLCRPQVWADAFFKMADLVDASTQVACVQHCMFSILNRVNSTVCCTYIYNPQINSSE
jgi:hypothetical protein